MIRRDFVGAVTLPLTAGEKSQLRKHKVRVGDIHEFDTEQLA